MPEAGFDPLGLDEPAPFKPAQKGIEGTFRDDQTGGLFKTALHFEAVEPPGPEAGERCQLDTTFAELYFPFSDGFGDHEMTVRSLVAYSQECSYEVVARKRSLHRGDRRFGG
jgi:hypothetical protein